MKFGKSVFPYDLLSGRVTSMEYDFDLDGMRRLGDFIRQWMESEGITMPWIVEQCARVGYSTNIPKVQRLKDGIGKEPPLGLLWAFERAGLIKKPDGTPYRLQDFLLIATGHYDPKKETTLHAVETPYPEAIATIRKAMKGKGDAEFAKDCNLKVEALREILSGRKPTLGELLRLGNVIYPDHNATPLFQMYGANVNAPVGSDANKSNGKKVNGTAK